MKIVKTTAADLDEIFDAEEEPHLFPHIDMTIEIESDRARFGVYVRAYKPRDGRWRKFEHRVRNDFLVCSDLEDAGEIFQMLESGEVRAEVRALISACLREIHA